MPRLTVTEVSRRAGLLPEPTPYDGHSGPRLLAQAIWLLLRHYDQSFGTDHPLGHQLREIEKQVSK